MEDINKCSCCECPASHMTFGKVYCQNHSKMAFDDTVAQRLKILIQDVEDTYE